MALPFSYILQSQFCLWEYRSAVTQIFIYLFVCLFPCKYIAGEMLCKQLLLQPEGPEQALPYWRSAGMMEGACQPLNGFTTKPTLFCLKRLQHRFPSDKPHLLHIVLYKTGDGCFCLACMERGSCPTAWF